MKNSTPTWLCLIALFLLMTGPSLSAQKDQSTGVIITQKITRNDGSTTVVKKKFPAGTNWENYVQELEDQGEAQQLDLQIEVVEWTEGTNETNTVFRFRRANPDRETTEEAESEWRENSIKKEGKAGKWQKYAEEWIEKSQQWDRGDYNQSSHGEDRAFLGVYSGTAEGGQGVLLEGIVGGSGAQAAGLKEGDILTTINGERMSGDGGLTAQLAKYKPGDTVAMTYLREGREYETQVTLSKKKVSGYSWSRERDPCKVFIGVYTEGYHANGQSGRYITSIIKGTSAEEAALEAGDIIVAIDGVPVNTHEETINERDKHQPGDYYTISYLREGVLSEVEAQFKPCGDEEETIAEEPVEEEVVVMEEPTEILEAPAIQPESDLELRSWSAFPNPTVGKINVRFEAEARPTTLQVVDAAGKVVYKEVINNFDGYYNRELNLSKANPGALFIQVRQGEEVNVEKILLITRV